MPQFPAINPYTKAPKYTRNPYPLDDLWRAQAYKAMKDINTATEEYNKFDEEVQALAQNIANEKVNPAQAASKLAALQSKYKKAAHSGTLKHFAENLLREQNYDAALKGWVSSGSKGRIPDEFKDFYRNQRTTDALQFDAEGQPTTGMYSKDASFSSYYKEPWIQAYLSKGATDVKSSIIQKYEEEFKVKLDENERAHFFTEKKGVGRQRLAKRLLSMITPDFIESAQFKTDVKNRVYSNNHNKTGAIKEDEFYTEDANGNITFDTETEMGRILEGVLEGYTYEQATTQIRKSSDPKEGTTGQTPGNKGGGGGKKEKEKVNKTLKGGTNTLNTGYLNTTYYDKSKPNPVATLEGLESQLTNVNTNISNYENDTIPPDQALISAEDHANNLMQRNILGSRIANIKAEIETLKEGSNYYPQLSLLVEDEDKYLSGEIQHSGIVYEEGSGLEEGEYIPYEKVDLNKVNLETIEKHRNFVEALSLEAPNWIDSDGALRKTPSGVPIMWSTLKGVDGKMITGDEKKYLENIMKFAKEKDHLDKAVTKHVADEVTSLQDKGNRTTDKRTGQTYPEAQDALFNVRGLPLYVNTKQGIGYTVDKQITGSPKAFAWWEIKTVDGKKVLAKNPAFEKLIYHPDATISEEDFKNLTPAEQQTKKDAAEKKGGLYVMNTIGITEHQLSRDHNNPLIAVKVKNKSTGKDHMYYVEPNNDQNEIFQDIYDSYALHAKEHGDKPSEQQATRIANMHYYDKFEEALGINMGKGEVLPIPDAEELYPDHASHLTPQEQQQLQQSLPFNIGSRSNVLIGGAKEYNIPLGGGTKPYMDGTKRKLFGNNIDFKIIQYPNGIVSIRSPFLITETEKTGEKEMGGGADQGQRLAALNMAKDEYVKAAKTYAKVHRFANKHTMNSNKFGATVADEKLKDDLIKYSLIEAGINLNNPATATEERKKEATKNYRDMAKHLNRVLYTRDESFPEDAKEDGVLSDLYNINFTSKGKEVTNYLATESPPGTPAGK